MNENENEKETDKNDLEGVLPGSEESKVVPDPPVLGSEPKPVDLKNVPTFEALLKKPMWLVDAMVRGEDFGRIARNLLLTTIVCLGVFGLVVGTYSMGTQLWAAPLKITLGMIAAGLICLPSLYIFSCLSGIDVKISAAAGVLSSTICLTSLLLLGFTPVVWIFSQSINSIAFMGALALFFWVVATYFGLGMINRTADYLGMKKRGHLVVWMLIFIVVSLQMSTTLRPIVGKSEHLLTGEKKFFLTHWAEQLDHSVDDSTVYRGGRSTTPIREEKPVSDNELEENPWE